MLKHILQNMFSHPRLYDQMQIFFGFPQKCQILKKHVPALNDNNLIIDLGGGTGLFHQLWPSSMNYICLDNDWIKLKYFLKKYSQGKALFADASNIPIKTNSVDAVLCTSMSHHIPLEMLDLLVEESHRILKIHGKFIFLDAVLLPNNWFNQLLWKFDRGSYPHTKEDIYSVIKSKFDVRHQQCFNIIYDYTLVIGQKPKL